MMVRSRTFEQTLARVYLEGKSPIFNIAAGPIPGELHLSIGQEPVAAGLCINLRDKDTLVGSHRAHHMALAKGVSMTRLAAEIFGKKTGLSQGKGGHMHLFDPPHSFMTSSIVGQGIPTAVGQALAFKKRNLDTVAVVVFGEGAANQGSFHEALNLAGIWKLPVIFVCEDNGWAGSTAKCRVTSVNRISDRASSYGISGMHVSDNDVVGVYQACAAAVAKARNGEGATLIEVETQRICGHYEPDTQTYRSEEELESLKQNDAMLGFERYLLERSILTELAAMNVWREAEKEADEAMSFARSSPFPEAEEALDHVFAA
jgi:pyruvate dehydrogenase E1 component alpha subunit